MELKHTPRGFSLVEFKDSADNDCSIQESSSASETKIWFGVDGERMLLSQIDVKALLPLLQTFAETGELSEGRDDA